MPAWLIPIAWVSVALGVLSSVTIAVDIARGRRQKMTIMNVVWPLTALYSGPLGLWAYFRVGTRMSREHTSHQRAQHKRSLAGAAALGATHCGSGCCLGDIVAESIVIVVPLSLFGARIFGTWVLDFALAFLFGIAFQYFTIKPMRNLSVVEGLKAAVKADAASLTAWQVGMYGWMAAVTFLIFGHELEKSGPVFWFMMQLAMLAGFVTSWPVNAWLISKGLKERM